MQRKVRVAVNVQPPLLQKVEAHVGFPRRFENTSQAFEWSVAFLMEQADRFGSLEEFERFVREAGAEWLLHHPSPLKKSERSPGVKPRP
jgi:hypothetical protein